MDMDSAYISAIAALLGSVIGGFTSLVASWVTQTTQARTQQRVESRNQRRMLYTSFIDQAAKLYGDAVFSNKVEVPNLVSLYALISHMRLMSPPEVIDAADKVARFIIETYFAPNKSLEELRTEVVMNDHKNDPLTVFSEACRADLNSM